MLINFCIRIWLGLCAVNLFYYLADGGEDGLVIKYLLGRIHEQDIYSVLTCEHVLLLSPCLSDTSFAEVALDCSLEYLLGYGYENPGMLTPGIFAYQVSHARNCSVTTFGKQLADKCLAAESFFFLKCI